MNTLRTIAPVALTADNMALIGRTLADLRGHRFDNGEGGNAPAGAPSPATVAAQHQQQQQGAQFVQPISGVPGQLPPQAPPAGQQQQAQQQAAKPDDATAEQPKINPATGKPFTAAETQAYITKVRDEAKQHREAKEAAEKRAAEAEARSAAILKAAGFNPDGTPYTEPDAGALQTQLDASGTSLDTAKRENLVLRVAMDPTINANADALLDSRAFCDKLSELKPDDREGITALVKTTIEKNPTWKNTPPTAAASGGTQHGGTQDTKTRATMADAVKARMTRAAAAAAAGGTGS